MNTSTCNDDSIGDGGGQDPLISVCIGVFNRERYIRECLDSVFAQTCKNIEVIVVDDASTDKSVEILKSYGDAIKLVERPINSGNCAAARNDAMRLCSGEYIALLDSDDSWMPEKLERQLRFMREHPELALSYTYCQLMDQYSVAGGIRHEGMLKPEGDVFEWLLDHCWISTSTVMFKRSIVHDVGLMNESPDFRIGEDWEFFIRIAKNHEIGLLDDVLTNYRRSEAGISMTDWRLVPRSVYTRNLILNRPEYWRGRTTRRVVVDKLASACQESSIYWRERGHSDRARWFDAIWLRHKPFDWRGWMELAKTFIPRARKSP